MKLNAVIPPADRGPVSIILNHTMILSKDRGRYRRRQGGWDTVHCLLFFGNIGIFTGIGFSTRVKEVIPAVAYCNIQGCEGNWLLHMRDAGVEEEFRDGCLLR